MFISLERPKYIDKFLDAVKLEDEILECHYLAGDYDYSLKIITENTDTLERLLNRIKSVQGVQKTKTTVVLSTVKNSYSIIPVQKTFFLDLFKLFCYSIYNRIGNLITRHKISSASISGGYRFN